MTTTDDQLGVFGDLCAKLDLHIGSVSKMTRTLARAQGRPPAQPVFGRTTAAGVATTGNVLILRFPLAGPDQGHFWYIRSIVIGGLTPTTTAAGRADIYVSASNLASQPTLAAIGLGDWRDQEATLPAVSFYNRGALPLRLNEELFVVISNGTNLQNYVASVQFEDYEEAAAKESWSL